jgi:recombination protein RecT
MSNLTTREYFTQAFVQDKFKEMLGKRAPQFITSVLQIVASNSLLKNADPVSVYQSAAVAATLDLPLNNSLGFAYIVPYNQRQKDGSYKTVAQFQMGYKAFIQLAYRSGQFLTISSSKIYEGQVIEANPLTGYKFDFSKKTSDKVIGYAAYFKLINGAENTLFMSTEELTAHGKKFSQTFAKGYGLWKDDFDAMASKTVLKLLLSKFAPLSVEMQTAIISDQSVVLDAENNNFGYPDNEKLSLDLDEVNNRKERERIIAHIKKLSTQEELDAFEDTAVGNGCYDELQERREELTKKPTKTK